jgi:RNA polymerase sigma-70 factor (ECF subfamily)
MNAPDLEQIYTSYYGKVMGYISARIRNRADAEDLCSEVFIKIQRKLEDYDPSKASISTWVFTITRNTVIDHFRRSKPTEELDENLSDDSEVDESLLNQETLSELAGALKKLPQQLMDILVLRYYDGKPLTEIAELMNLSYGAVKLRHQNALMLLRQHLHVKED